MYNYIAWLHAFTVFLLTWTLILLMYPNFPSVMEMTPKVHEGSRGGRTDIFPELVRGVGSELRHLLAVVENDIQRYKEDSQQEIKLAQKVR